MTLDQNIAIEERPRFPLAWVERANRQPRMSRKRFYEGYWPMRVWSEWIGLLTPFDMRVGRHPEDMDFVDYKLSTEEKEAAVAKYGGAEDLVLDAMDETTIEGYKVTFSYDQKNRCALVSVIGRDPESSNFDKCMTTRHGSVRVALIYALFKHREIYGGKAWATDGNESMWG